MFIMRVRTYKDRTCAVSRFNYLSEKEVKKVL